MKPSVEDALDGSCSHCGQNYKSDRDAAALLMKQAASSALPMSDDLGMLAFVASLKRYAAKSGLLLRGTP